MSAPQLPGSGDLLPLAAPPCTVPQTRGAPEMQSCNRTVYKKRPIERYAVLSIVHINASIAHDTASMQAEAALYLIDATMLAHISMRDLRKL